MKPKSITANFNYSLVTTPPYTISGFCYGFQTAGPYSLIGSYYDNGYVSYGIAKQGNYVYMKTYGPDYYDGGLAVFDISTPSNPVQVNSFVLPNSYSLCYWLSVNGNYLYVPDQNFFYIYDISTPSDPNLVGTYNTGTYLYEVKDASIVGNYAFLGESGRFEILDISTPSNLQVIGSCPLSSCIKVDVEGNYAYVANYRSGLSIIDITSYSNPTIVGQFNTIGFSYDVKVRGNYAYLANANLGLFIIDISNPTAPQEVGEFDTFAGCLSVTLDGDYAYLTDFNKEVMIIDIKNPQLPIEVTSFSGGFPFEAMTDGNYIYTSDYGLKIYTIPQPLTNVTVSLSGDTTQTSSTDSTGYYEFDNLTYGNYTVRASMISTAFTPVYYTYAGLSTNEPNQNFYGGMTISITLASNPTGRYVTLNNTSYLTPFTFMTITGYYFTIGVNSTQSAGTGIQNVYDSWSDGGAIIHTIFPISDTTYTVSLDTQYYLTEQASPSAGGSVTPGSGWYNPESIVNCQVNTNFGYKFVDWSGDLSGTTNSQSVIMDAPITVTANFSLLTAWDNVEGDFDVASDTGYWGFETPLDIPYQAYINWVSSLQGESGLLMFQFYDSDQEIKMTSKMRFTPDLSNPWYTVRITYYLQSLNGYMNLIPSILTYADNTSLQIEEIGVGYCGEPFEYLWSTIDVPLYCRTSSGQIQLIVKNNNCLGNLYIDSIELLNQPPSAVTSSVNVNVPYGDFSVASDTTQWAFEIPPGSLNSNGIAAIGWITALAEQTGVLTLGFDTSYQGAKITSLDTFNVPANHSSIMSFKVYSSLSDPTEIQIIGILFSFNNETTGIWDIGGYANIGAFAGDSWNTVYVPLTAPLNNTDRIQLIVKNTSQFPATIYINDIQLYYDPNYANQSIPTFKPTQNIEAELIQ